MNAIFMNDIWNYKRRNRMMLIGLLICSLWGNYVLIGSLLYARNHPLEIWYYDPKEEIDILLTIIEILSWPVIAWIDYKEYRERKKDNV